MKILRNVVILAVTVIAGWGAANAQTAKSSKKAVKQAAIKSDVENKRYTFIANYAQPMRGSQKTLTSEYDLRITPDSLVSFLPYYGQAYFDIPYNPTDGGIKFTSTKFDYAVKEKKGGWEITIDPKDAKDIQRLVVNISKDGYALLSVTSTNKDFISFDGYLKE